MAHQWDPEADLGDIIQFALDFKKLQSVLKSIMSGMDSMKLDITKLQEQQLLQQDQHDLQQTKMDEFKEAQETLLTKVNSLETQIKKQSSSEDQITLRFQVEKMQRDHADEMIGVHNSLNALRDEMTNLNTEVIATMQVSSECKAAVFSTKNEVTNKFTDVEKKLVDLQNAANSLTKDSKDYAMKADLHSSVQTMSSRLANTEKSMATEFGSFNAWKEKHEGLAHITEDKLEALRNEFNLLKTFTDELSPTEVKKAISNLSREMAKLRALVKEHIEATPVAPPPPPPQENPSPVPPIRSIPSSDLEALQREMLGLLNEQNKKHFDLRRDVSDLGTLLEALTTGVKGTDQQRQEYAKMIEDHGKQLSHLLRTKADISVIETMMVTPKPTAGLSAAEKEELAALREIIKSKASKTELAKIRKKLDEGAYNVPHTHDTSLNGNLDAAITRVHFRCLACDRVMAPNSGQQPEGTPPFFDLGPNIAYRRWKVKDMVKDTKSVNLSSLTSSYP